MPVPQQTVPPETVHCLKVEPEHEPDAQVVTPVLAYKYHSLKLAYDPIPILEMIRRKYVNVKEVVDVR